MNLYLMNRTDRAWYDQYDGAVIAAKSSDRAYDLSEELIKDKGNGPQIYSFRVDLIGRASKDIEEGYILTSFLAG